MVDHRRNKSSRSTTDDQEELIPYEDLGPDPLARLDMRGVNGPSQNPPSRPMGQGQYGSFKVRTRAPRMTFPDSYTDTGSTNTATKGINGEDWACTRRFDSSFSSRLRNQQPQPLTISTGAVGFVPRTAVITHGIRSTSSHNLPPTPSTLSPWISVGKENNIPHSPATIKKKRECFIKYAADPFAKLDDLTPGFEPSRSPLCIVEEPQPHFSDSEDDDKPNQDNKEDNKEDNKDNKEHNKDDNKDNKLAKWFSSIGRGRGPRPSLAEQQQTEPKYRRRKLTGILRGTTKDNITALGTTDAPRPRANTTLIEASPAAVIINGRPNTMPTTELELASMAVGRAM